MLPPSPGLLLLALQALCTVFATGAAVTVQPLLSSSARRRLQQATGPLVRHPAVIATPLSKRLHPDALLVDAEAPADVAVDNNAGKRPFKMAFFDVSDSWQTPELRAYVMDRLMPAAASTFARVMRVRNPTGPLPLIGFPDENGTPLPDVSKAMHNVVDGTPPEGNGTQRVVNGSAARGNGIDADILMKVQSGGRGNEVCLQAAAYAIAYYMEETTQRPIYGVATLCSARPGNFAEDLETLVHEIMHALVMYPQLYGQFPGYASPYDDVILQAENSTLVHSPQVREAARRHFNCSALQGAALEDDLGSGSSLAHWEMRLFSGELMDAVTPGNPEGSAQRATLTDLTLSLLQDSNWYDVKYGSAGFNSHGYKAGCEFAMGTYDEAITVPSAQRYLCENPDSLQSMCLPDHSAEGFCESLSIWDGFTMPMFFRSYNFECYNNGTAAGTRCLSNAAGSQQACAPMSCSANGTVLINGSSCDPEAMMCPPDEAMCRDPGFLTCVDTLNDCSGHGTCKQGACYCHLGWGGAECSVPICIKECGNGSPCPPSGFCGVPECGTWSSGSANRGVPCHSPPGFSEPPISLEPSAVSADDPPTASANAPARGPVDAGALDFGAAISVPGPEEGTSVAPDAAFIDEGSGDNVDGKELLEEDGSAHARGSAASPRDLLSGFAATAAAITACMPW